MQDRQSDCLLQLLDGVARFGHHHDAVDGRVIGLAIPDFEGWSKGWLRCDNRAGRSP